jgi:glycosyltransferase involved in cell wall biosynthesis
MAGPEHGYTIVNAMASADGGAAAPLNILHVFRAPVGGLFRHVVDLARGQTRRGHRVGIVADSTTGGATAEATLAALASELALGITRVPMSRQIGPSDVAATRHVAARAAEVGADILHGHGAKGGAYARLAGGNAAGSALRVYTPHGGSLHYRWGSPVGFFYLAAERLLMRRTDLFLFESAYGRDVFTSRIGKPRSLVKVVHNGVTQAEFAPVSPAPDATDLVFVGELRMLKGVDVLIEAVGRLALEGRRRVSATIVGTGPDEAAFQATARELALGDAIRFVGAKPARVAFGLGRVAVVPSRAESLPYIVLEAAAAGLPIVATRVGGIPEIFGPDSSALVPAGDVEALAQALVATMAGAEAGQAAAARLRARVQAMFSADVMTEAVLAAYAEARASRRNG